MSLRPAIQMLAVALLVACANAYAQPCPAAGAKLKLVQDVISDLQKNGRAPAGADCGQRWASSHAFSQAITKEDADFFTIAADVQRRAFEKRAADGAGSEADVYLDREITIRRKFLDQALKVADVGPDDPNRRAVVQHLSFLVSAMALRRQYEGAAAYLADRKDPSVIDDEALKVWLQAVWSCAKWDGNKTNVCGPASRQICRDKITVFLDSISTLTNRKFPPQARLEIQQLKQAAKACRR